MTHPLHPTRPSEARRGVALVTALGVLLVVGVLIAGTLMTTQIELGITRNDATATQAQYAAEAGLQAGKAQLFQYYRWIEDNYDVNDSVGRAACFSRLAQGLNLDRSADMSFEKPWGGLTTNRLTLIARSDGTVTNATTGAQIGEHEVVLLRDGGGQDIYTIESRGFSNGARATVRSTVLLDNTGVLEQAIFSGRGQANKFLNGGVTIRGGIYVVGDETDPDNTVINSNGDFSILNDYDLTTTEYGGIDSRMTNDNATASNLCATLRVQDGRVGLSGSVKLGDPANNLLGVYVGDNVEEDLDDGIGPCEDTKGICADEVANFDLERSTAPEFPVLDNAPASERCSRSSWRKCIDADASFNGVAADFGAMSGLLSPQEALEGALADALTTETAILADDGLTPQAVVFTDLTSCSEGFTYNTDTGTWELTFDRTFDCTGTKEVYDPETGTYSTQTVGFKYKAKGTGTSGQLQTFGNINLKGVDVTFPQGEPVEYFAKTHIKNTKTIQNGAFVVQASNGKGGDTDINDNFLTGTGSAPGNATSFNGFPDHVLAMITERDTFIDGDYTMAPIYAGETFRIVKDRKLVGSVIADYFCTTGAGGTTAKEKKNNSKSATDKCNAGQKSEVVYVNTGNNKPEIMRYVQDAGAPIFEVLSYEVR